MATQKAVGEEIPVEIESVEAILDDLDNLDLEATGEETIEEISEDDVTGDDLRDLEIQIEREAAYEEQTSNLDADAGAVETAKEERKKNPVKVRNPGKSASTPRAPKDLNAVAAEFFVLEGDVATMDQADIDDAKTTTMMLVPTQKKIAEKFENLFSALAAGKLPSTYVVQAFKLLDGKGAVTSTEIVNDFKGTYKQGTAMSQAGQIMHLFATVKIADRSKNTLTLNKNSVVAGRLRGLINAPKA